MIFNILIIIPYFELLRTLFYQASRRLTHFFLSFLSLKLLCQPLDFSKNNNSLIARFYVASQQLTESEARILGGLLFDPALKNIYDLGQNHWLSAHNITGIQRKSAGNFSKSIMFNADGYDFTYNSKQYIWVNSLQIVNSPYNFQELLFHPINDRNLEFSLIDNSFICSDLLKDGVNYAKLLELHRCLHGSKKKNSWLSSSKKERSEKYLNSLNSNLPKVTPMPPWSNLPLTKKKFYWLDRELSARVQSIDNEPYKNTPRCTPDFYKILGSLKASGYLVDNVTLNNPQGIFGKGLSVFPVKHHTPLPINAYRGYVKAFTLARVCLNEGPAFLTQPFPEQNPNLIFLCQKQDMSEPTESEWNKLFNIIKPINNYNDYNAFYKSCAVLNRNNVSTNSALIALAIPLKEITVELCVSFNDHLISRFRKRLQFYIAAFLKYPKGMNYAQHKELIRLSRNICKAPDSLWIARIYGYWVFK